MAAKRKRNTIRLPKVQGKTGLGRTLIWQLERQGLFPARVQLGPRAVGWYEDEVDDWVESRPRANLKQPEGVGA